MDKMKILCATGMLGRGLVQSSLESAIDEHDIDFIACDSGSNDGGPGNYAGSELGRPEGKVEEDLRILLNLRDGEDIPILIGSTGCPGTNQDVDRVAEMVERIASDEGLDFDLAKIYTEVEKGLLHREIDNGNISKLSYDETLSKEMVDNAETIVGQVGTEPFIEAIEQGSDVILGGRCLDIAQFSAIPVMNGFDRGTTYHLAKLLECGNNTLKRHDGRGDTIGQSGVIGVLRDEYFEIFPAHPDWRATINTVRTQILHEKSNPTKIWAPEGEVDITEAEYEQRDESRVRVSGSSFEETDPYTVLIEGVEKVGYRTISLAGVPDPNKVDNIDSIIKNGSERFREFNTIPEEKFMKRARVYGNGESFLFDFDEDPDRKNSELGIVIDVVGDTQEIAREVNRQFTDCLRKVDFDGKMSVGGNVSLPISTSPMKEFNAGPVLEWSIYHLLEDTPSSEIASIQTTPVGEVN
jgi:hypothetical protein